MPLTEFQKQVLKLLRLSRNPNSYIAGGIAIHRAATSTRYSNDVDFFHDTDEAVVTASNADIQTLKQNDYQVTISISQPSFIRATISQGQLSLKLEWVRDTAFRFFPVIEDDELGYRLHDVDLMVNKCLALANRTEVRDIIDLLQMNDNIMSLAIACWASCGKDPGFTPDLLIDCMRRHSIIDPQQLAAELLHQKIQPQILKQTWLKLLDKTEKTIKTFPSTDLGCLYLDEAGEVIKAPNPKELKDKTRHYGSIGGSWPRIAN